MVRRVGLGIVDATASTIEIAMRSENGGCIGVDQFIMTPVSE